MDSDEELDVALSQVCTSVCRTLVDETTPDNVSGGSGPSSVNTRQSTTTRRTTGQRSVNRHTVTVDMSGAVYNGANSIIPSASFQGRSSASPGDSQARKSRRSRKSASSTSRSTPTNRRPSSGSSYASSESSITVDNYRRPACVPRLDLSAITGDDDDSFVYNDDDDGSLEVSPVIAELKSKDATKIRGNRLLEQREPTQSRSSKAANGTSENAVPGNPEVGVKVSRFHRIVRSRRRSSAGDGRPSLWNRFTSWLCCGKAED